MTKKPGHVPFVQSLDRGLTILQTVARSKHPVTLGELAELLEVDRSSVFRLAQTLRRRGFLTTPSGQKDYVLGSSMWTLSRQYDWSNMLVRVAHEELKSLAQGLNETAHLAIREGKSALFIDSVHARHVIAVAGQSGELVPLYATAHGKALLADSDAQALKALFGPKKLEKYTKTTITSVPSLAKECVEIRRAGMRWTKPSSWTEYVASQRPFGWLTGRSLVPLESPRRRPDFSRSITQSIPRACSNVHAGSARCSASTKTARAHKSWGPVMRSRSFT